MPIFLERMVLPLLVAALVIVAVTNAISLPVRVRVYGSIAIIFAGLAISEWLHTAASSKVNDTTDVAPTTQGVQPSTQAIQSSAQVMQERIFVTEPLQQIMDSAKGFTEVETDRFVEPYIGKWAKLSGEVADVSDNKPLGHGVLIRLKAPGRFWSYSNLYFDHDLERIRLLHADTHITVVGQISKISQYGFFLEQCELISVNTP
jgi:hypothetical protein